MRRPQAVMALRGGNRVHPPSARAATGPELRCHRSLHMRLLLRWELPLRPHKAPAAHLTRIPERRPSPRKGTKQGVICAPLTGTEIASPEPLPREQLRGRTQSRAWRWILCRAEPSDAQ